MEHDFRWTWVRRLVTIVTSTIKWKNPCCTICSTYSGFRCATPACRCSGCRVGRHRDHDSAVAMEVDRLHWPPQPRQNGSRNGRQPTTTWRRKTVPRRQWRCRRNYSRTYISRICTAISSGTIWRCIRPPLPPPSPKLPRTCTIRRSCHRYGETAETGAGPSTRKATGSGCSRSSQPRYRHSHGGSGRPIRAGPYRRRCRRQLKTTRPVPWSKTSKSTWSAAKK